MRLVPFVPPGRSRRVWPAVLAAGLGLAVLFLAVWVDGPREAVRRPPAPPPAPEPPPAPPPAPPLDPLPMCRIRAASIDPRRWTVGPMHLGPFTACDPRTVEVDGVRELVPDHDVKRGSDRTLVVSKRGKRVLLLRPTDGGLQIEIYSPLFATPQGVHVGDRLARVRDRNRGVRCHYGYPDPSSRRAVMCAAAQGLDGDGWIDELTYELDPRSLTRAQHRALAAGHALRIETYDRLRVVAIHWMASHAG